MSCVIIGGYGGKESCLVAGGVHDSGVCAQSWQVALAAIMAPCQLVNTLRCCVGYVVRRLVCRGYYGERCIVV